MKVRVLCVAEVDVPDSQGHQAFEYAMDRIAAFGDLAPPDVFLWRNYFGEDISPRLQGRGHEIVP